MFRCSPMLSDLSDAGMMTTAAQGQAAGLFSQLPLPETRNPPLPSSQEQADP